MIKPVDNYFINNKRLHAELLKSKLQQSRMYFSYNYIMKTTMIKIKKEMSKCRCSLVEEYECLRPLK
jgi:hypothetical protein